MNERQKRALRWIVQGLILTALLFFFVYVFFGPTGQRTGDGGLMLQKHERRLSRHARSVNDESQSSVLSSHKTTHPVFNGNRIF
jgi:hypothetical protein